MWIKLKTACYKLSVFHGLYCSGISSQGGASCLLGALVRCYCSLRRHRSTLLLRPVN